MDISEDMIKRSILRAAEDETAGRMGGAPTLQNLHFVGDEEYLPLLPKYVLASSDAHYLFSSSWIIWPSLSFSYPRFDSG